MQLTNYINDLLYRYDCVIVPNFGGFITNKISAQLNETAQMFFPPAKQITFNAHLKHNDGLLANYIASVENISFDEASEKITTEVIALQTELSKNTIELDSIGTLSLNQEGQYIFQPNRTTNFLTDSYGLSQVEVTTTARFKEVVVPLLSTEESEKIITTEAKSRIPLFIKYAATAAILLALGVAGYRELDNHEQELFQAKQQHEIEQKIQEATFVIDTPLPTINLNLTKEKPARYHLIAGAFKLEENAKKKVLELRSKGFDSKLLGKNKWGLHQVSYNSFTTNQIARKALNNIRKTEAKDVWLLVKN